MAKYELFEQTPGQPAPSQRIMRSVDFSGTHGLYSFKVIWSGPDGFKLRSSIFLMTPARHSGSGGAGASKSTCLVW